VHTLSKGANAPLPSSTVEIQVVCSSPVDVSALLLTAQGKVRSDDDMIFYNQPSGPGVAHRAGTGATPDAVTIGVDRVPADIDKVVVTASLDGSGPATFGAVGNLVARVLDGAGTVQVEFPVTGLGPEKALVCVEVYRRGDAWKVRAVGQGYAAGLAGIATDFGITVDDAPPPAAAAAPPAPAAPPDLRRPDRAPAAQPPDLRRPDRAPAPPPPTGPPAAFPPPPAAAAGRVNLDKGRVSLRKQQTVSLVKTGAPALKTVRMGLGWDPVRRGADVDLDASVIAFDVRGRDVEKVWYGNLRGFGDAILHSGDNLTGEGEGDDELITIALDRLPKEVEGLVFTVNSFRGQKFTELKTAYCRLLDDRGDELVRYDLGDAEAKTGVLMAKLVREPDGTWSMTALGEFHDGRNVKKMVDPARETLGWRR
jgi:stress response protein SCP2